MKKFFLKSLLFSGLLLAGVAGFIFFLPYPENAYNLAVLDKRRNLAPAESPKLVLAGGSNLAYGIDSAAIRERFNIPVVNIGVNAGFGLGRILDLVSPFLNPGDTLLIVPEYEQFTDFWDGNNYAYILIFDARQYRLLFSPRYGLPAEFSEYISSRLQGFTSRFRPPDPFAYARDGFNEYGDYVKHLGVKNQPFSLTKELVNINNSHLKHFYEFIDDFTRRGITVLLSYPSYEEESYRNSAAFIEELDNNFRAKENLRVISKPESYRYPANLFYDSVYHLNGEGRALRTAELIGDLEAGGPFGAAD